MRTTEQQRKDFERQLRASVASLGSGYQSDLMVFADELRGDLEDMLAENARLQARVEEAEHRLQEANEAQREIEAEALRVRRERDISRSHAKRLNTLHNAEKADLARYKALAEQRKEARRLLERLLDGHDGPHEFVLAGQSRCSPCDALRAEARAYLTQPSREGEKE